MDIRKLVNSVLPMSLREKESPQAIDKSMKTDSTTDRDANGQAPPKEENPDRGPLSDEEFEKAVKHLKALPAVKEHSWSVQVSIQQERRFVLILDHLGKTIRRIPEAELWSLLEAKSNQKGQLLRKSA